MDNESTADLFCTTCGQSCSDDEVMSLERLVSILLTEIDALTECDWQEDVDKRFTETMRKRKDELVRWFYSPYPRPQLW